MTDAMPTWLAAGEVNHEVGGWHVGITGTNEKRVCGSLGFSVRALGS